MKLSAQWSTKIFEEKVEDIISPKEESIITPEELIPAKISEIIEEETITIPETEIIEEKKWFKIVQKWTEKDKEKYIKLLVKREELITFIQNIWDDAKINTSFISENSFTFEDWEKSIIFKQVRDKINTLIDELDYKKLYFLLEISQKIELNLNLEWLRRKFFKLALSLTKTEKNNKIFQKFLDKYIINN
jgi:hypothetical protein